jgi:hypothetical protein
MWFLSLALCCAVLNPGCAQPAADDTTTTEEQFEPSTDDGALGTLKSSDGVTRFEMKTNDDGEIETVEASGVKDGNDGSFTLPTADSNSMSITSADGGMVTIDFDELTTIHIQEGAFDQTFQLDASQLAGFDLGALSRGTLQSRDDKCSVGVTKVDAACGLLDPFNLDDVQTLIMEELDASGNAFPGAEELISDFLHKYLDMIVGFCDDWTKYRGDGGQPCDMI